MTPSAPFNVCKIGKYFQKGTFKITRPININQNIKEDLRHQDLFKFTFQVISAPQISCAFPRLLLHSLYASD